MRCGSTFRSSGGLLRPSSRSGRGCRWSEALDVDDATWRRARGWALNLGLRAAAWAGGNSVLAAVGRNTVAAVVADAAAGRLG